MFDSSLLVTFSLTPKIFTTQTFNTLILIINLCNIVVSVLVFYTIYTSDCKLKQHQQRRVDDVNINLKQLLGRGERICLYTKLSLWIIYESMLPGNKQSFHVCDL